MPKTRKFIDKKKAITFQLVHRSQQDPLIADENAPQRVLVPIHEKEKRLEEQHKYGIYYNDDCNYLEHLKDSKDNQVEWPDHVEKSLKERRVKLDLPATVFASKHEEKEGMLSKAAPVSGPQLQLDPDLVAAMDEDFDYSDPENQLEDNFIELAEGVASDQEFDDEFEVESDLGSEERDEVGSLPDSQLSFNEEETKSRFTSYSMTSSVIRRNEQLTLLDDRFEQMYADYDDNEIGALDCEEIEGHVPESSDILLQYAQEFEKSQQNEKLDKEVIKAKIDESLTKDSKSEEEMVYMEVPQKEKWDCESILSTYSNIYNHPKLIKEPAKEKIQISKKTGIPMNILGSNKLTQKALDKLNLENEFIESRGPKSTGVQSVISQLSTLSVRPRGETPDERRDRKKLLKDYKRERRLEKKANALAFKEEAKRQVKISMNNRNNVQGNKIL
ncbi:protein LTV1 homolog [Tribolium castaneum]|uniref:Protein LTV1 homolog n=1 Tax=Tribolium castaneum TaxID=7070 RepID=D6WQU3_TRICA|nr:PREDICTED: protein LTV1 homolog [Tribolium castaneum]EFA07437.1 Protein LTV1 homolog-like Protein [Tribolium castaneum]|eukprot:XP_008195896.1 PREDICTED: protein LTV1 homolog [Tribolium castaneum]